MSRPTGLQKVSLVAKHIVKHKQILMYENIEATEDDHNYIEASELFLVFRAQMKAIIIQTEIFQTKMSETLSASIEQADTFVRMSQGGRKLDGRQDDDWLLTARARTSLIYSVVKEGTGIVKQIMDEDLSERLLVALKRELDSYSETPRLMHERLKTRMEVQHYCRKIKELDDNPKVLPEKIERNKEKYAQAVQALHDQTDNLMDIFSKAERLRQQLLCDDLNTIITLQQRVFDSFSNTIRLTSEKRGSSPHETASCTDTSRTIPSICTQSIGSPLSLRSLSPSISQGRNLHSLRSPSHSPRSFSDVPLDGTLTFEVPKPTMQNAGAVGSSQRVPLDGEQQATLSSPRGPTCRRRRDDPKGFQSNTPCNNTCTSIGTISNPNAGRMAAPERVETQSSHLSSAINTSVSGNLSNTDNYKSNKMLNDDSSKKCVSGDSKSPRALRTQGSPLSSAVHMPVSGNSPSTGSSKKCVSGDSKSPRASKSNSPNASKEAETPPGMVKVRALFDYDGTEEGDLSFMADDTIITSSIDWAAGGWVEGTNGSRSGVFPSNYCTLIK